MSRPAEKIKVDSSLAAMRRIGMTSFKADALIDPREVIRENLKFLREYAKRLLAENDDSLVPIEDFKEVLMKEYLAVGASMGLTERDLMVLMFRNILEHMTDGPILGHNKKGNPLKSPGDFGNLTNGNYSLFGETFNLPSTFTMFKALCGDLKKWSDDQVKKFYA